MHLRKTVTAREEKARICEINFSADTKVSGKGAGGGAVAEIPLQAMVQTMVRQLCPRSPWRSMAEQRSTCSWWRTQGGECAQRRLWLHEKPVLEQVPGRSCSRVETGAHTGAGLLGFIIDPVGDTCWSTLCLQDCTPWNRPTLEQFMKNCSPWEGEDLIFEEFEDYLPWKKPRTGAGETVLP